MQFLVEILENCYAFFFLQKSETFADDENICWIFIIKFLTKILKTTKIDNFVFIKQQSKFIL